MRYRPVRRRVCGGHYLSFAGNHRMKSLFASLLILSTLTALAGCQQPERPIGPDGRPNVPAEQPVPGGPMSKGPVGQPQA